MVFLKKRVDSVEGGAKKTMMTDTSPFCTLTRPSKSLQTATLVVVRKMVHVSNWTVLMRGASVPLVQGISFAKATTDKELIR